MCCWLIRLRLCLWVLTSVIHLKFQLGAESKDLSVQKGKLVKGRIIWISFPQYSIYHYPKPSCSIDRSCNFLSGQPQTYSQATAVVWELVSCGLWLLMHDSWSKHAFMQVISMHWTSTIIIIYLELGLSKSPSAQVKTMTNDPYPVSVKAHVENVFFNVSITKRRWKDQWHGLNVTFFCCSNNVKMQVYSAQTNKKKSLSTRQGFPFPR